MGEAEEEEGVAEEGAADSLCVSSCLHLNVCPVPTAYSPVILTSFIVTPVMSDVPDRLCNSGKQRIVLICYFKLLST